MIVRLVNTAVARCHHVWNGTRNNSMDIMDIIDTMDTMGSDDVYTWLWEQPTVELRVGR